MQLQPHFDKGLAHPGTLTRHQSATLRVSGGRASQLGAADILFRFKAWILLIWYF